MSFEKAKVTIDLDEYNELIKLKEYSNSVVEAISQEELSKSITALLQSVARGNGVAEGINKVYRDLHIRIEAQEKNGYTDFKFIKSINEQTR